MHWQAMRLSYNRAAMKIFVTGVIGYIGSRLIPLLVRRGHQAKTLVRRTTPIFLVNCMAAIFLIANAGDNPKMSTRS
jgi:nucleoside-diphosphate-sugar epimerase